MGQYDRKAQSQRKHGPLSVSSASKAPAPPPNSRPEWRGSGYIKKRPSRQQTAPANPVPATQEQFLPVELQQLILNIFRTRFPASEDFDELKPTLHEINNALLQKDLEKALGSEENREYYSLRWSPSRSLAYSNVLAWICDQRPENDWVKRMLNLESIAHVSQSKTKVICFGGGAAEVMAFAGLLRHLRPETAGKPKQHASIEPNFESEPSSERETIASILDVRIVDSTDWSSVVSKLQTGLLAPPVLSKYASAAAQASNAALLSPQALGVSFQQANILGLKAAELRDMIGTEPVMVTLFLTLNDLYTTGIPKTTGFLRKLDAVLPKDSLLLVIDSIGASTEVGISNEQGSQSTQSYPMDWLLNRALLGKPKKDDDDNDEEPKQKVMWEKVVQETMRQHKLDEKLRYPGSLENVKFQVPKTGSHVKQLSQVTKIPKR